MQNIISETSCPLMVSVAGALVGLVLTGAAVGAIDENTYAPDIAEPGSVEAIARDTTEPQFVSPWVAYLPEAEGVPSPTDYLGRIVGAAGELTRLEQIYGYLRALADASARVHLEEIGRTEEEREILLVVVADEAGIRELDRLKAATAALADPRTIDPDRAEEIIAGARPIYDLPRRWSRMAYCTACLDGPVDTRHVVLQWGTALPDAAGKVASHPEPMVVSGGARNEDSLRGRPAILAIPKGDGVVVAFNFNPTHRDLNRSDHRLLWNGVLNWQALKQWSSEKVKREGGLSYHEE
jgi:hypothetical protein